VPDPFYLDSSTLLKRYKSEPGTELVAELVDGRRLGEEFASSYLAAIEVEAVARRALRGRALRRAAYQKLLGRFYEDAASWLGLRPVDQSTAERAAWVARQYGLRAPDAIHLGAATLLGAPVIVSGDRELLEASKAEGYDVLNPEDPEAMESLRAYRSR
jgi:predicted nucleic acid-binding protein